MEAYNRSFEYDSLMVMLDKAISPSEDGDGNGSWSNRTSNKKKIKSIKKELMSHFYVRACPNGHYEIDYKPARKGHTCRQCGEQLIDSCPNCGAIIKDWNFYGASMMPPAAEDYVLPHVCPKCGNEFPWKGKKSIRVGNKQSR